MFSIEFDVKRAKGQVHWTSSQKNGFWALERYPFHLESPYYTCGLPIGDWIYWLFIVLRPTEEYFTCMGDVTITGGGLQNLGLCSVLRVFEQGGIFIVPHLLWHGASVFPFSAERLPHLITSYDLQGDMENLLLPKSSWEEDVIVPYWVGIERSKVVLW
jgi:hypothetical protein